MRHLLNILNIHTTPQSRPVPGSMQVPNSAGGYSWAVDEWTQLDRFLILGTESGTYYTSEPELTAENARALRACLRSDGVRAVRRIAEISESGRAPRNTPALFALAVAASPTFADAATNRAALAALSRVARTGTHLCEFAAFAQNLRGWGRSLRSAVAGWYVEKPVKDLAYQMLKYKHRADWSHRDLLRLAHPKPATPEQSALFQWAVDGAIGHLAPSDLPSGNLRQIFAAEQARKATQEHEIVRLIEEYDLTHDMIPSEWKNSAHVWEALLERMPYTAVLRNLAKMTQVGLLAPLAPSTALAITRLTDARRVRQARVHPIAVLSALLTYKQGKGMRGWLEWAPVGNIIDALDEAFYLAFDNVEPTGRRIYLAIDASGSMQSTRVNGLPFMDAAMGAAAMALTIAKTEPNAIIAAFHDSIWHVDISRRDRLDRACEAIERQPRGTDASLPMKDALERGLQVDAFVILTDSETWAGDRHPVQALNAYRKQTGIAAKMVVIAMAANRYSIADPNDPYQMDVAGFDSSVPGVVSDFLRSDHTIAKI
jgi:60 kDa SS-A/Ro ribonucleoprotein